VGRITLLLMVLTEGSGTRYHKPSARDAHRRIVAFFNRHLPG
jgi:carboxymethylenebutenolidase